MHLGCIYTSLFRSSSVQKFRKIVLVKDFIDHPLNVSRIWITNNQIIGIKTCFLHFNFLHLILLYQLYLFCSFSVKRNRKTWGFPEPQSVVIKNILCSVRHLIKSFDNI